MEGTPSRTEPEEPPAPRDPLADEAGRVVAEVEGRLSAIGLALERLESREHGRCEVCGADLPDELLAEDPAAGRCAAHLA